MQKYIKEVFSDYNPNNHLANAEIGNINLYKKTNKLQVEVVSGNQIGLQEIQNFEDYLIKRFKVNGALLDIQYKEDVEIEQNISENWTNILGYISKKEPCSTAFLRGSKVEIDDQKVDVKLAMKGAAFLIAQKFDKGLEHLLGNMYNKQYKVEFVENVGKDYDALLEKKQKEEEKSALLYLEEKAKEDAVHRKEEIELEKQKRKEEKEKQKAEAQKKALENLPPLPPPPPTENGEPEKSPLIYGRSLAIRNEFIQIANIPMTQSTDKKVCVDGEVLPGSIDSRDIKIKGEDKVLLMFNFFDGTSTIGCKVFVDKDKFKEVKGKIAGAKGLRIDGTARYSQYSKEVEIMANTIIESTGIKKEKRMDNSDNKRVELHMHTQMSQMDAITPCEELLKRAISWGWKSIAITDHGVVQSFPEAHKFLEKTGADLKVIYGVEAYFVPDKDPCVFGSKNQSIDTEYCVFDLETTGISRLTEKITEVGIIKIRNGEVIDTFECFVNPEKPIPAEVVAVTHITDDMVKDAETIDKVMPKILEFMGDSVLVAHNADFDIGFLKHNCAELRIEIRKYIYRYTSFSKSNFPRFYKI